MTMYVYLYYEQRYIYNAKIGAEFAIIFYTIFLTNLLERAWMHLAGEDKNKIPDIIKKKEWKQMVISVHNGGFFLNMDRHGA